MHDDITLTLGRVSRVQTERIWGAVHAVSAPFDVEARALPANRCHLPRASGSTTSRSSTWTSLR